MAEHTNSGHAELGAPMDYDEHERTFARFVSLTKITILATICTMVALVIYAFGAGGFWLGTILILLMLVGTAVSVATKGSAKPLLAVAAIGILFFILSVA